MTENMRIGRFATERAPLGKALRSSESVVYVDVGTRKIDANVSRDGVPVGVHTIDVEALQDAIVTRPTIALRVVSQSIPPGTPVPVGASVDLVMARPLDLPVGVVTGVLADLRGRTIGEAFTDFVAGRPEVNRIITRAAGGALSNEDESAIRSIFADRGVQITDQPGHDISAAVESLRVLTTFGR